MIIYITSLQVSWHAMCMHLLLLLSRCISALLSNKGKAGELCILDVDCDWNIHYSGGVQFEGMTKNISGTNRVHGKCLIDASAVCFG